MTEPGSACGRWRLRASNSLPGRLASGGTLFGKDDLSFSTWQKKPKTKKKNPTWICYQNNSPKSKLSLCQTRSRDRPGGETAAARHFFFLFFEHKGKERREENYSTVWPEYLQRCVTGWLVEGNRYCGKTYESHLQRYLRSVTVKSPSADPPSVIGKAVVFGAREPFVLVIVCQ